MKEEHRKNFIKYWDTIDRLRSFIKSGEYTENEVIEDLGLLEDDKDRKSYSIDKQLRDNS